MHLTTLTEIRCQGKVHGVVKCDEKGKAVLEVRCKDGFCSDKKPGVIVYHYYDIDTWELIKTKKWRDPYYKEKPGQAGNERLKK